MFCINGLETKVQGLSIQLTGWLTDSYEKAFIHLALTVLHWLW